MNEIIINEVPVTIKEYQGQRVVTLKDIDTVHGRADGTAGRNFRANRNHFIENEDYFTIELTTDEIRRQFGAGKNAGKLLTLITESGYLMLVKSFTDDLAWSVQRQLIKIYFRAKAKHDSYLIDDPIERAKRWIEEQEAKRELETTIAVQNQQIAELQPKASYYDMVLNCKDLMPIKIIAADYGKSAIWLNQQLQKHHVQHKESGVWLLYHEYAEKGYTSTKTYPYSGNDGETHCRPHTYWTQKGRLFIYDLLKSDGILPLMERNDDQT